MLTPAFAPADVCLPGFFSDGLIVQRDLPLPVWGWAAPDEIVTVRLAGQSQTARADRSGRWMVRLAPVPATLPGEPALALEVAARDHCLTIREVLAGEVWLCSGQSNMEFTVTDAACAAREIASANHPRIRQFLVPRAGSPEPRDASFLAPSRWQPATPDAVGAFTAVGYAFAREISRALGGMPIGLLNSAWGGTAIQSWMSLECLRAEPGRYERLLEAKKKELADWPARLRQIKADTRDWEPRAAAARATNQPELPNKPWNPGPPDLPQWTPANLYHGMVHPLVPCALRGVLWYQGESNAGSGKTGAAEYTRMQADLIRHWRAAWDQGEFPFYYVQLPNWRGDDPAGTSWAWFREGQARVLDVPNTGMAVSIDVGESENIHPADKQPVGRRLARIALRHTYGLPVTDSGPIYRDMFVDNAGAVHLRFDGAEGGMIARNGALQHFQVAGTDRQFHCAQAAIEGRDVVVSSAQVLQPVAVRYAWANDPAGCNLYNKENLPAAPFRTDNW